ncbi:PIR Superfamily Protein [Plasmodium ovale curtisi]|uniref:PIR Superfamily Protein n=1 Tax=Plasmodium ovale curtisi TaxID=864141 RepID=A0A1A8XEU4_PLAOA|nr:PIR Superfamily Protein [Plasmodium ovale curtisi]
MAQVTFSSNNNTEEELREKCIEKLADIIDEVNGKVDKLRVAKEGDEQFLQICGQLSEYQNRYNKKDTECTEAVFLGLYEGIKSSIGNALKKCTSYQESIRKLVPEEKEPGKKETLAEDQLGKDGTKEKTQQAKGDQVMSERNVASNGAGSPVQNEVDDPGTSVKEQTIASAPSNLGNSKGKGSGGHQKAPSQDSDQASCDPKKEPESRDLDNGKLPAGGPAPTDGQPLSNGLSPEHGSHPLQVSHLAGDASPGAREPFTANSLLGSTSSGPGLPPDPVPDSENGVASLQLLQTPEGESELTGIKIEKKKRQMIQEELDRLMNSPSIFDEKNMYLPNTHLEKSYEEYRYEY